VRFLVSRIRRDWSNRFRRQRLKQNHRLTGNVARRASKRTATGGDKPCQRFETRRSCAYVCAFAPDGRSPVSSTLFTRQRRDPRRRESTLRWMPFLPFDVTFRADLLLSSVLRFAREVAEFFARRDERNAPTLGKMDDTLHRADTRK